jgi:hypothetical protein
MRLSAQVWRNGFVTEALDVEWLKHYLQHDAGVVYQSFQPEDSVFAIYTFFCWHLRDEFSSAHNDLCLLAGLEEKQSKLWRYTAAAKPDGADNHPTREADQSTVNAGAPDATDPQAARYAQADQASRGRGISRRPSTVASFSPFDDGEDVQTWV